MNPTNLFRPGAQLASLDIPQNRLSGIIPQTQPPVAKVDTGRVPEQKLAQAQKILAPSTPPAERRGPFGLTQDQAKEFLQIRSFLGKPQAAQFLQNLKKQDIIEKQRQTPTIKERTSIENTLRDDFKTQTNVAKYIEANALFQGMMETIKDPSGKSDIDLVFALANIFDPGSVVREGEAGAIKATGGAAAWISQLVGFVNSESQLSAHERIAMVRSARRRVVDAYGKGPQGAFAAAKTFQNIARDNKVNPGNVVTSEFLEKNVQRVPTFAELPASVRALGVNPARRQSRAEQRRIQGIDASQPEMSEEAKRIINAPIGQVN